MKTKRMSLYIVSVILLVIMILGTLGVATWALLSTKLEVGGNIGFQGTGDVKATISNGAVTGGSLTNAGSGENAKLQNLTIREDGVTAGSVDSWKELQLAFTNSDPVTLSFDVTNDLDAASDKYLQMDLTKNFDASEYITATVTAEDKATGAAKASADSVKIAPQATVTYKIVFTVSESTNVVTNIDFSLLFNLSNTTYTPGPIKYTLLSDGTYEVAAGSECEGEITIPATYNGKVVSKVAENGFKNCTALTSVKIAYRTGESTLTIGGNAFAGCTQLESLTIEQARRNSVVYEYYINIGANTFDSKVINIIVSQVSIGTQFTPIASCVTSGSTTYGEGTTSANAETLNGKTWTVTSGSNRPN